MGISLGTAVHSGAEMSTSARVWRHPATQPLLAGAVGLVLSLIAIGQPSVWYDEAATVTATTRSWGQLWQMLGTVDAVHGAYYVLIHAVVDVFGYSPTIIRIPSAIAVGAGAALTVLLARQAGAPRLAFLAGLLFCLMPRATWMGTEARSYALSAALAALITLVLITARRSNTWRWWVLYGALTVLSCLVFSYLALVVAAHGVTMLWWWLSRRGVGDVGDPDAPHRPASVVLRWFLTTATAGVALVPFFLAIVGQSKQVSWIPRLGEDTPRQVFRTQWFFFDTRFAIVGCVLIVIGAVLLLVRRPGRPVAQIVLPALVLPTVALLVATELFTPLYSPRYLTLCLPFVAITMAAAVAALTNRLLIALAMAVIVALAVPSFVEQREPDAKQGATWSEVADLIAAEPAPSDKTAIIYGRIRYHVTATSRVIAYSYPEAFRGTIDVTLDTPAAETDGLWETRNPLAESLGRLDDAEVAYLVTSIKRDWRPGTTETLATIGWGVTGSWTIGDVNVLRFEPGAAAD